MPPPKCYVPEWRCRWTSLHSFLGPARYPSLLSKSTTLQTLSNDLLKCSLRAKTIHQNCENFPTFLSQYLIWGMRCKFSCITLHGILDDFFLRIIYQLFLKFNFLGVTPCSPGRLIATTCLSPGLFYQRGFFHKAPCGYFGHCPGSMLLLQGVPYVESNPQSLEGGFHRLETTDITFFSIIFTLLQKASKSYTSSQSGFKQIRLNFINRGTSFFYNLILPGS